MTTCRRHVLALYVLTTWKSHSPRSVCHSCSKGSFPSYVERARAGTRQVSVEDKSTAEADIGRPCVLGKNAVRSRGACRIRHKISETRRIKVTRGSSLRHLCIAVPLLPRRDVLPNKPLSTPHRRAQRPASTPRMHMLPAGTPPCRTMMNASPADCNIFLRACCWTSQGMIRITLARWLWTRSAVPKWSPTSSASNSKG